MTLKLGTRGSDLALAQARWTARALESLGQPVEIVVISTAGDRSRAPSFGSIGPQGVFVKEIEDALLGGDVDLAVHSCKDLPTASPAGLVVAAVPARVDAADYLLVNDAAWQESIDPALPVAAGATIGTSSARRQRWLRHLRADVVIEPLRGNVPTRIRRVRERACDAIVLAHAGIQRLRESMADFEASLAGVRLVRLDPAVFVPAPAQGALALQCRSDDRPTRDLVVRLDDPVSHACVAAERGLLARAEGGCDAAFGAHCRPVGTGYEMLAMAGQTGAVIRASASGSEPQTLIDEVWAALGESEAGAC